MRIINLRLEEDYRSDDDDDDGGGSLMTKQLFAASDKMENAMNRPPTHTHTHNSHSPSSRKVFPLFIRLLLCKSREEISD